MKKEIEEKLRKANEELKLINTKISLVVVGGAAFIMKDLIPRSTYDIDYINKLDEELSKILNKFTINNRVVTYEATFGDWSDDVEKIESLNLSNIDLKTISTERLLVSRLFSRKRFNDFEYVFLNETIDKNKFEEILQENFSFADPIFLKEWNENKNKLKDLYKTKGWNYEKSNIKKLCEK